MVPCGVRYAAAAGEPHSVSWVYLEMDERTLVEVLDDIEGLLQFEPEDLAAYIFAHLQASSRADREAILYKGLKGLIDVACLPIENREEVVLALAEAWQWLEREGLIYFPAVLGRVCHHAKGQTVQDNVRSAGPGCGSSAPSRATSSNASTASVECCTQRGLRNRHFPGLSKSR